MNKWANAVMVSYAVASNSIVKFLELLFVAIFFAAIPALLVVVFYNMIITILS